MTKMHGDHLEIDDFVYVLLLRQLLDNVISRVKGYISVVHTPLLRMRFLVNFKTG